MKKLQVAIDDQIYKMFKMSVVASDADMQSVLEDLIYNWCNDNHKDIVDIARKEQAR